MTEPLYGTPHPHGPLLGPLSPPLLRSTTAGQPDAEALRALGAGERPGEFYQRLGHGNGRAFESLVAALEGADGAVAFASGMAAMSAALAAELRAGIADGLLRVSVGLEGAELLLADLRAALRG